MSDWPLARRQAAGFHSIVNGLGVLALASLHLFGELPAEWAAGGILALCGLWVGATRATPPSGPPGGSGAAVTLLGAAGHLLGRLRDLG